MVKIGILAIQGSREEHEKMLRQLGCKVAWVRTPRDLESIKGIILPGGESTAIGKALHTQGLFAPLQEKIKKGLAAWGTCAGAILLAKKGSPYSLKLADVEIERNAYGRQIDSFEKEVFFDEKGAIFDQKRAFFEPKKIPAIFIRAPRIKNLDRSVKILAKIDDEPIAVRQNNILLTTFHPELTSDLNVHQYFVRICS